MSHAEPLNRHEEIITIKIIKAFYDQDPTHWETKVTNHNGEELGTATGPNFHSVFDSSYEIITGDFGDLDDQHNPWVDFNSNRKNNG